MNIQNSRMQRDHIQPNRQFAKYNKGRPVKILLDATHAFCRFDRPGHSEIQQYKDFFYSLIDQTSTLEKREISIALARNHYTPRAIAIHLALGEVSGSTPVLLFSPVLKEVDLLAIAEKCQISGIRVLARRDGLSPRLMKVIDGREDAIATRILHSETARATISTSPPFKKTAPEKAVTKSAPSAIPTPSTSTGKQQELLNLASRGGRLGKNKSEISTTFATNASNIGKVLTNAARNRDIEAFCTHVSNETSLDPENVRQMVISSNPTALCKMLKAMNIPNANASQMLLLLNREIGTSIHVFRATMADYDLLSSDNCREEFLENGGVFEPDKSKIAAHTGSATATKSEQRDNASKLENALRRRQEALGPQMKRPLFRHKDDKNMNAA